MYRAEELRGLKLKPRINDVDLRTLQDYYSKFLNPFIYQYDVVEDKKQKTIQLRFDEENFCHLLGIESIVKYSVSRKELHNYKGQDGWNFIKNAVVHLCIKKDELLGYYIPKTFFVEKMGEDGGDIYIDKQKKIEVIKKNRIIML